MIKEVGVDVTVGNFYETFGAGDIFSGPMKRAKLGTRQCNGWRAPFASPHRWSGNVKMVYGKQRLDFDSRVDQW